MIITSTSIAFILLGLGLGLCGWCFIKAFSESSNKIPQIQYLLSIFLGFSSLQNIILGLGLILFAQNQFFLFFVLLLSQFVAIIHSALGLFIVFYIFFPKKSPVYLIFLICLSGLLLIGVTISNYSQGVIISEGLGWTSNLFENSLMFFILFISIGSFVYIFSRIFLQNPTRKIKFFSLLLALFGIGGLINIFIRFILANITATNGYYLELGNIFIGFGICLVAAYFGGLIQGRVVRN